MEKEKAVTIGNVTYLIQRTYVGTCTKAELIRNGIREKTAEGVSSRQIAQRPPAPHKAAPPPENPAAGPFARGYFMLFS